MRKRATLLFLKTSLLVLVFCNLVSAVGDPDDVYWSTLDSDSVAKFDGPVFAMILYKNSLIIGGGFKKVGSLVVNHIVEWNGSTFSALGTGVSDSVFALAIYQEELIAGGLFTAADGRTVNGIAVWTDSGWMPLKDGLGGRDIPGTNAMTVFDNRLIVGGWFLSAGNTIAENIASWDGTTWEIVGGGLNYYPDDTWIDALTVYDNKLIVAGYIRAVDTFGAHNIVSWDGSHWNPLGKGTNGTISAVAVYGNTLVAGGNFSTADRLPANDIALWDGQSWSPLGMGMIGDSTSVFSLSVHNNQLIAGGLFHSVDGVPAERIASCDGNNWSPLGSGVNGGVRALCTYNGNLIVGGNFSVAGGKAVAYLAEWSKKTPTGVDDEEDRSLPVEFSVSQNYPNPFNPSTTISYDLPKSETVRISVVNVLGRTVTVLIDAVRPAGHNLVAWDGKDNSGLSVASGVYFFRIESGSHKVSKKMMLLR